MLTYELNTLIQTFLVFHRKIISKFINSIIGRVDSVASTLVRIIDVIYHKKALMSYEYTYDLQDGQVSYAQVLPFQWYRFNDSPDIVKVVEFFGLSNSQVDESEKFDSQAFYHDILEVIGAFNHAFRAKSVIPPFSATVHILKALHNSHSTTVLHVFFLFAGSFGWRFSYCNI